MPVAALDRESSHVKRETPTSRPRRRFASRRLLKDVLANLYLAWLRDTFPRMPIVMVIRHPIAVAASKGKEGIDHYVWLEHPKLLLEQPDLVADFLDPYVDEINRVTNPFDAQIVIWAIAHLVPFRQLTEGQVHLTFYEHLCESPESEFGAIESFLQREPGRAWKDPRFHAAFHGPSETASPDSAVHHGRRSVESWMRHVTTAEIDSALKILDRFGLGGIYGAEAMPNPNRLPWQSGRTARRQVTPL